MTGNLATQTDSPYGRTRWDRFLYWANRVKESPEFDKDERDYKLDIAKNIEQAKTGLFNDDPT